MAQDESDANKLAERKFMHDLATPIAVASGQLEVLLDLELGAEPLSPAQKMRIEKAKKALDRIRDMLAARRKILVADIGAETVADETGVPPAKLKAG